MHMLIRILPALLVLALPLCSLAQTEPVPPQPLAIDGATTHIYKLIDDTELRLHVFTPADHSASDQRPAIVFFFGGGWTEGSVEQFVPQSRHLAGRGMIAIVADYRVRGRHGTTPFEAMADARSAIQWVRAHAAELGVDADRIAASGGSAGGHIALSAGALEDLHEAGEDTRISSKPNALVLFNPRTDTAARAEVFGPRWQQASPAHHLGDELPPTVVFHGTADETVPYAEVEKFCADARNLHNSCEVFAYEDATHGFFNPGPDEGKWYRETLLETDRFLMNLGYLPTPDTQ
jgi:acetyl esterase